MFSFHCISFLFEKSFLMLTIKINEIYTNIFFMFVNHKTKFMNFTLDQLALLKQ
jgi:hypothetical protein